MQVTERIFKVEAEGDRVFIRAADLDDARRQLRQKFEPLPEYLMHWTEVAELPEGEECA